MCRANASASPSATTATDYIYNPLPVPSTSTATIAPTSASSTPLRLNSSSATRVPGRAGSKRRCAPAAAHVKKSKQYSVADMVRLQMRQLQVAKQRLTVEREKVTYLQGIREELTMIRVTLGNGTGLQFIPVASKDELTAAADNIEFSASEL